MTILTIASTHATLAEAVAAAAPDLSYNPKEAQRTIKRCDTGFHGRCPGTQKAFVLTTGEIYSIYLCHDGVKCLNKFEPFHSVLSDSPFLLATLNEAQTEIIVSDLEIPKGKAGRKWLAAAPDALGAQAA